MSFIFFFLFLYPQRRRLLAVPGRRGHIGPLRAPSPGTPNRNHLLIHPTTGHRSRGARATTAAAADAGAAAAAADRCARNGAQ